MQQIPEAGYLRLKQIIGAPATRSRRLRIALVFAPAVAGIVALLLFVPPIPQDEDYHDFADQRRILGVDYFSDTASNLAFVAGGGDRRGERPQPETPFRSDGHLDARPHAAQAKSRGELNPVRG